MDQARRNDHSGNVSKRDEEPRRGRVGEYIRFQCSGFRIGIFPDTRNLTPDTRSLYSREKLDMLQ